MQPEFTSSSFDEPVVMWRMERVDGRRSHLVLGRDTDVIWAVWFLNETPLGMRDFNDFASAVAWADRMKAQNWSIGWRLVADEES
jgi:hypothetical protein